MDGPGLKQVMMGLKAIASDSAATNRLAAVSARTTGRECAWVSEIAYSIWRNGGDAELEASVGNIKNVDLVSGGEAFEVKSKVWESADRPDVLNFGPTDRWFGRRDLPKLTRASVPGYLIVAVGTPLDVPHRYFRSLKNLNAASRQDRQIERGRAIEFYRRYAAHIGADSRAVRHTDLGVGKTPDTIAGSVALDAIIIAVPHK